MTLGFGQQSQPQQQEQQSQTQEKIKAGTKTARRFATKGMEKAAGLFQGMKGLLSRSSSKGTATEFSGQDGGKRRRKSRRKKRRTKRRRKSRRKRRR